MEPDHAATSSTADGAPGSYALRELIRDVPLTPDEDGKDDAHITCVDAWNGNVYIGTSSGEVLHYVSIPPDPADESGLPSYIFATKIEPPFKHKQTGNEAGVKQILLLPIISKACIVCHSTLTFWNLPELSPAYEGRIEQAGCLWIGGLDRNNQEQDNGGSNGVVAIICLRQRLRVIRIFEEAQPRKVRDIELAGVSTLERRGDLACVADEHSYSLLDVVNQRKNELFPISSLNDPRPSTQEALPAPQNRPASRSFSSHSPVRPSRSHSRNISLGNQLQNNDRLRPDSDSPWPARRSSRQTESPAPASSGEESPAKPETAPELQQPSASSAVETSEPARPLAPHVVSSLPTEFLLTTGTKATDPGVGMFVNLEGDVVRGTIEFSSYPEALVLDGAQQSSLGPTPDEAQSGGYVLAIVQRKVYEQAQRCIEIQRWDADPGEGHNTKEWLVLEGKASEESEPSLKAGLRNATTSAELSVNGVTSTLRLRRLKLKGDSAEDGLEAKRNEEEDKLASRFAQVQANVLFFAKDRVSWVVQTPMVSQLDRQLTQAVRQTSSNELSIDVPLVQRVVNSIRGQEPRNELEFLTLTYVRQKSSLLLFGNLVLQTANGIIAYEHDKRRAEDALISGELDPRVVLALVPPLDAEIAEGSSGIWMAQGLRDAVGQIRDSFDPNKISKDCQGPYGDNLLHLIKRYLIAWRKKKGFGSVADETHVFQTVDAALLHVLLMLDQNSPRGPATAGTVRAELNDVVDRGVDCFERAVELFEQYNRLYMLSRLYQSRKMVSQVLATWKRILEGEKDVGGELVEGEHDLRRYLSKIRDSGLVQEYGSWLAHRNPKLGVQIFADDNSRVKFQPTEAVAILKEKAPDAVKDYLEHLVFGKNHVQYVNDLIAFYLDTVLNELKSSENSRKTLLQSYETYRALHPPKPTYREFITDNAIEAEWWHNRLRLLQLIGGSHGAASKYDVHTLGERLAPYSDELVPEMIILNGREGKHEEALRLLTHGLGDYDTAIRYCLLGGSSIFHPASGLAPEQPLPTMEEQSKLFEYLLYEFFRIEDLSEQMERTAELLERFGGWFHIEKVLDLIPETWSVELVSGFLVHAFRRLVAEKNVTVVVKALCSAQNLRQSADFAEKVESMGPVIMHPQLET